MHHIDLVANPNEIARIDLEKFGISANIALTRASCLADCDPVGTDCESPEEQQEDMMKWSEP